MSEMKYPETSQLARDAYAASGCKTHAEFLAMFGGAIAQRSFYDWLSGKQRCAPLAAFVLRQIKAGWRPKRIG